MRSISQTSLRYQTPAGSPDRASSNGFPSQPRHLVGILVAAAGEADDQDLAGSEASGFLERLGQGVAGLEGGEDAFVPGREVVGVEGFAVGDALVADPAEFLPI